GGGTGVCGRAAGRTSAGFGPAYDASSAATVRASGDDASWMCGGVGGGTAAPRSGGRSVSVFGRGGPLTLGSARRAGATAGGRADPEAPGGRAAGLFVSSKNGSSSAIVPSGRGGPSPRARRSCRE